MKTIVAAHIRWGIRPDMPQIMRIERTTKYPWSEAEFLAALRQRNSVIFVADTADGVVGYMVYELHEKHLRILNLAVHPEFQSRGIGTELVEKLKRKLSSLRREHLAVSVRESNLAAQKFFQAMGFKACRVRRGFYGNTGEDAIQMTFNLKGV